MDSKRSWASRVYEWWGSWFAGFTWKGVAIIVLLCAINALRRGAPVLVPELMAEYAPNVAISFVTGLIYAWLIALTVVAVCNRVPPATRWHYPLLVGAFLLSSTVGVLVMDAIEAQTVNAAPGQS